MVTYLVHNIISIELFQEGTVQFDLYMWFTSL